MLPQMTNLEGLLEGVLAVEISTDQEGNLLIDSKPMTSLEG